MWEETLEETFLQAKTVLVTAPCLSYPCPDGLFVMNTDASDYARGTELSQVQDRKEMVIAMQVLCF